MLSHSHTAALAKIADYLGWPEHTLAAALLGAALFAAGGGFLTGRWFLGHRVLKKKTPVKASVGLSHWGMLKPITRRE